MSLMVVLGVFTLADMLHHESGLFAVTVMGITVANQKTVAVQHIVAFKEVLQVLLISSLFILLGARIQTNEVLLLGTRSLVFLGTLIFVVRPVAWRSRLVARACRGRNGPCWPGSPLGGLWPQPQRRFLPCGWQRQAMRRRNSCCP